MKFLHNQIMNRSLPFKISQDDSSLIREINKNSFLGLLKQSYKILKERNKRTLNTQLNQFQRKGQMKETMMMEEDQGAEYYD